MKKVFVFTLLCLALLIGLSGVTSATTISSASGEEVSQSTTVYFGVKSTFTLIIPDDIPLTYNSKQYREIRVTNARIPQNTYVNVTMTSDFAVVPTPAPGSPAWRMVLDGNSLNLNEHSILYHIHKVTGTSDPGTGQMNYTHLHRVVSGDTILSASADAYDDGVGTVISYLEFYLQDNSGKYSGSYSDQIEFTAQIRDSTGAPYSAPITP